MSCDERPREQHSRSDPAGECLNLVVEAARLSMSPQHSKSAGAMHRLIRANPLTEARSRRFRSHMTQTHGASRHRPLRKRRFSPEGRGRGWPLADRHRSRTAMDQYVGLDVTLKSTSIPGSAQPQPVLERAKGLGSQRSLVRSGSTRRT
jgi:hypothetical protein